MHDARAIANYFINRAIEKAQPVTAMTLLKVMYFAHAWHLAKYDEPLVAQPFEAWKNGPVNRVVYDQIKRFGARPVVEYLTSFSVEGVRFESTEFEFDDILSRFLNNIFDFYARFHPFTLSDLTHEKGSPWDEVWTEAEKRAVPGMIIPNARIKAWSLRSGPEHLRSARQRYSI